MRVSKWQIFHFWVNYSFKQYNLSTKKVQKALKLTGKRASWYIIIILKVKMKKSKL